MKRFPNKKTSTASGRKMPQHLQIRPQPVSPQQPKSNSTDLWERIIYICSNTHFCESQKNVGVFIALLIILWKSFLILTSSTLKIFLYVTLKRLDYVTSILFEVEAVDDYNVAVKTSSHWWPLSRIHVDTDELTIEYMKNTESLVEMNVEKMRERLISPLTYYIIIGFSKVA